MKQSILNVLELITEVITMLIIFVSVPVLITILF